MAILSDKAGQDDISVCFVLTLHRREQGAMNVIPFIMISSSIGKEWQN